jgi:uncharacterized lipoprotein YmbA
MRRRSVLRSGLAAFLITGACGTSPDPVLYTLAAEPGSVQGGGPRVVMLRDIGLARYLDRPQIVRASDGYLLEVSKGDWWGEPLGRMIARVLVEELAQRLPGSTVFAESGAITTEADATVEVDVQAFAADASGQLVLTAQAAVLRPGGLANPPLTRRIAVTPGAADTRAQVAAMSKALAEFADALADALRG